MVSTATKIAISVAWTYACFVVIAPMILREAYEIRLEAINEYGPIIHEFDPYFNLRATEYLYQHGAKQFFQWFDYLVWYPLGRPVGTTIYPGMQFAAVFIKEYIVGDSMSLNDVCCYIPAWFGVLATFFTAMLAYECSLPVVDLAEHADSNSDIDSDIITTTNTSNTNNNDNDNTREEPFGSILECIPGISWLHRKITQVALTIMEKTIRTDLGLRHKSVFPGCKGWIDISSPAVEIALFTGMIMSIVPAHLMRSMGGGYDNESVAVFAMVLTFYLWTRSLRGGSKVVSWTTWVWGAVTGIAYFNMVAAWGGYVFVINLIGCHAALLVCIGRFSTKVYRSYTAFYIVGTFLAMQVPVVGWAPLKSLEQLGPCAVFIAFQLLQYCEWQKKKKKLSVKHTWILRVQVFAIVGLVVFALAAYLRYMGYFGPISARVRGLFVKHMKTGNPLVDSVAEHQPAQSSAYAQYLGATVVYLIPAGFMLVALRYFHDSSSFLLVYGIATYFFSLKMVRLILLTAPIASVFVGLLIGRVFGFMVYNILGFVPSAFQLLAANDDDGNDEVEAKEEIETKKKVKKSQKKEEVEPPKSSTTFGIVMSLAIKAIFVFLSYQLFLLGAPEANTFYKTSHAIAKQLASPTIVMKGTLQSGETVLVDDYRECYHWIRDNTPQDARIMAWWDYGYQLTQIANRTTIADGNTWNHEHIALLGRALTSPEKEGHRISRHLADYILVWAGGGGDDVAKSPHLARIANSVYRDMCPGDPTCSKFGYTAQGQPSKMMRESMLYKLHSHGIAPGVVADPNRFREQYTSRFGKCRVFKILSVSQESKEWVAHSANRKCDVAGGWYCPGQYPPGMQKILSEKKDFSQLEDFNNKGEKDSEYQKQYFENLEKKNRGQQIKPTESPKKKPWKPNKELSKEQIDEINKYWKDSPTSSHMWELISQNKVKELITVLSDYPEAAHSRSGDGRGPMFWAMEFGNGKIVSILKKVGVSTTVKDERGVTPMDLIKDASEL